MAKKELPHNTDAEKAVLGSMLRSAALIAEGAARLDVEDFYPGNENHRAIYNAMLSLYKRGEAVDAQTVINELINQKALETAGGTEYLIELADTIVTFNYFNKYMDIVKEQALLRNFLTTIAEISDHYFTKDIDNVSDFLALSERKISEVVDRRKIGDFQKADEIAGRVSEELKNLKATTSDSEVTGTPTGFSKLNMYTHGFHPGELIILAARPAVGKTALGLNLAFNAASKGNVPVAFFSLEMPADQLFKRLIAADADVDYDHLNTGFGLDQNTRLKIQQACERLAQKKIFVDDTSGIKILDLVAKAKKLKANEPDLGLIVVDYIGLITPSSTKKSDSRQLEVQMITQTLKKLALEIKVPIIGIAQLNRKVEERGGEPQLSDLRESGSIEQDADIVMMIHSMTLEEAENQNKNKKDNIFSRQDRAIEEAKSKAAGANGNDTRLVYLLIKKNRSGRTGKVPLLFRRSFCKFDSLSVEAENQISAIEKERINYIGDNEE